MNAVAYNLDGCLIESRHAILPSMPLAFEQLGMAVPSDADELAGADVVVDSPDDLLEVLS